MKKMENKIAIYAICKNEMKFIDKWINSMMEADCICVLDTGSTDGTYEKFLELQKQYPEKIIIKQKEISPWRFDVARNESLKLVPEDCNILMCTDLDELLDPGWAQILREEWIDGKYTRCMYKYIWSHLDNGEPGRIFGYNKIHDRNWIWKYPVHELLWNKNTKTENYSEDESLNLFNKITLQHYPDRSKSRSSYLPLLELRAKEYKDDYYGLIYLSHEYHYHKMWDKSNEILQKTLDYIKKHNIEDSLEEASCYLFLGDNYEELGRHNEAIYNYLMAIKLKPSYIEPYIDLGKTYLNMKEYEKAVFYIQQGLKNGRRHYTWLERDISWSYEPYDLLCLAYYYGGNKLKSLGCAYKALTFDINNKRLKNNVDIILKNMNPEDF